MNLPQSSVGGVPGDCANGVELLVCQPSYPIENPLDDAVELGANGGELVPSPVGDGAVAPLRS